jgi:c-di-GMP-binding flagellar brake protein YcgR
MTDEERPAENRREYVRVGAAQTVQISSSGKRMQTLTIDLSGGGMCVTHEELELGAVVHFTLELGPGDPPIHGKARVVRQGTDEERFGLKFEEIDPAEQQRLIRFIFQCQRAALARVKR